MPTMLSRFGPPLVLMALIFFLSAQPGLSTNLGVIDFVLRKLAHMTEFGLLWLLWWRAFGYRHAAVAAAIALGYAATDELHQTTVEGRVGSPWDWVIDAAGVAVAALLVRLQDRRGRGRRPWRPATAARSSRARWP